MSAQDRLSRLSLAELKTLAASLGVEVDSIEGNRSHKVTYIAPIAQAMTEENLGRLRLVELQSLVATLDVEPDGNPRHKASYVVPIMAEIEPAVQNPAPAPARRFKWRRLGRVVAAIAVVALVLWGVFSFGRYAVQAYKAQLARVPVAEAEAPEIVETEVEVEEPVETPAPKLMSELTTAEGDGLIEIAGDGALMQNLSDSNRYPAFGLEPETGVVISMDPGAVLSGTQEIVSSEKGMLISIYNASEETLEFSLETGYNIPNDRWNIHAVAFEGEPEAVFERASEWQGTIGSTSGEHKPVYRTFVIDATGVIDAAK